LPADSRSRQVAGHQNLKASESTNFFDKSGTPNPTNQVVTPNVTKKAEKSVPTMLKSDILSNMKANIGNALKL